MREVADVHRELYAENADLYGANVAAKIETCLAVTDGEYEAGLRAREAYREQMAELFDEVDLLVTPTLPFVAPPAGQDERELRGGLTASHLAVQRARRARARPAVRAGRGRPARVGAARRAARRGRARARGRHAARATSLKVDSSGWVPTNGAEAPCARAFSILLALAAVALRPCRHRRRRAAAPTGLRAFLLRADEPVIDTFPRTPSFAWAPYERARSYDFELATSKTFDESTIVWSTASRTTPLAGAGRRDSRSRCPG